MAAAPLVLADARRVAALGEALLANRRLARPGAPALAVLELPAAFDARALLAAREVLVLATGEEGAAPLRALLAGPLAWHRRLTVLCDPAAARGLPPAPGAQSDRVVVVLGHREPHVSPPEHPISAASRARLRRAARSCRAHPPRAVVLTGYTRNPHGLSEAEQMAAVWPLAAVPLLLEDAGRNTAENAGRSLPLIRAIGGIRRVTVVTSAWHLRAPLFFAPYRALGLELSFAPARGGPWPAMLANELRQLPAVRAERRRAMAEAGVGLARRA